MKIIIMIVCEENVFNGDQRVPPEPTTSEIDFPPRGEQPLSVEAGMKEFACYGTLTTDLQVRNQLKGTKPKQRRPLPSNESAPLLEEDERLMLTLDRGCNK